MVLLRQGPFHGKLNHYRLSPAGLGVYRLLMPILIIKERAERRELGGDSAFSAYFAPALTPDRRDRGAPQ
jgi:hypothetical protein